jgi:DNA-binding protein HU-beta
VTKAELVRCAAEKANVTQKVAGQVLDAALEAVQEAARRGDRVNLPGFGAFVVVATKERAARDPRTGAEIRIPAGRAVRFRAGKALRDAVK